MYNLIKNFLVATLVVVNTFTLGGSTKQTVETIPTIKEIEVIKGYREQLLVANKDIKIVKRKLIEKPKGVKLVKDKPEVFVEVTTNNEPVKEEVVKEEPVKEVEVNKEDENEVSKDNIKDDTKKVNETVEELDKIKEDVAVVQANEVAYNEVVGEVYASEVPYEEIQKTIKEETVEITKEEVITKETNKEEVNNYIEPSAQNKALREYALSFYGGSYVWGGSNPSSGFDCSGLIQYIYSNYYNIYLPRTASEQANTGFEVAKNNLIEGDLIIFQNSYSNYPDHIGIYIGNGEYLHASSPSRGITTDSIYGNYFESSCISVRRHIGESSNVVENIEEEIIEEEIIVEEEVVEEEEVVVEEIIVEEDNSYSLTMSATAYTHTGNPTASGVYPTAYHTVSVDPNVIPLGTKMYIEG